MLDPPTKTISNPFQQQILLQKQNKLMNKKFKKKIRSPIRFFTSWQWSEIQYLLYAGLYIFFFTNC